MKRKTVLILSTTVLAIVIVVGWAKSVEQKIYAQAQDFKNAPFAEHHEYITGFWDAIRMTNNWNQDEAKELTNAFEIMQIGSASNANYYNVIKERYKGKDVFMEIEMAADKLEDMYMKRFSEKTFLMTYRDINNKINIENTP